MKFIFLLFALTAATLGSRATEPGARVDLGRDDAAWQPLFHQLAHIEPTYATFTEKRMFPFRRVPTELEGEMRLDPIHGLSLHYLRPDDHILVADRSGLLQRDAQGHARALPQDSHVAAISATLLSVLTFDVSAIARNFDLFGSREGTEWRLEFVPHDAAAAKTLGHLIVVGEGQDIRRLEFARAANQYVEISFGPIKRMPAFAPEDLHRFFR